MYKSLDSKGELTLVPCVQQWASWNRSMRCVHGLQFARRDPLLIVGTTEPGTLIDRQKVEYTEHLARNYQAESL